MSKICCGITYSDNDKFCRVCGKKLDGQQMPQAPVAPMPQMGQPQAPVAPMPQMGQPQAPVAPMPQMGQPQAPVAPMPQMGQPQAPVAPQPPVEKKVEEDDEPGTSVLTADMMGPIDHSKDNEQEEEELGTSVLTADMMGPIDHSKDNEISEPGTSILTGGMMGQPIPTNNQPMMGQPMMGQPMMGQPMQQKPAKPVKSDAEKEKVNKALGIVSMIVAGVGLIAIGVLLFFFVIKPSFKKYEGVADQGLNQNNPAVATVLDATESEE